MRAAWVLLGVLALGAVQAQFPDLSNIPGVGDISGLLGGMGVTLPDFTDRACKDVIPSA